MEDPNVNQILVSTAGDKKQEKAQTEIHKNRAFPKCQACCRPCYYDVAMSQYRCSQGHITDENGKVLQMK